MIVPGYWNRPDATERTLPDGELRTGDVGFMDENGWFYLVDRKKDMIVASGVQGAATGGGRHPAPPPRRARGRRAVVGVPDAYRGEAMWAYVSLRPGAAATPEELTEFPAAPSWPPTSTRGGVEVLADLPKTPTGELLRRGHRAARLRAASAPDMAGFASPLREGRLVRWA